MMTLSNDLLSRSSFGALSIVSTSMMKDMWELSDNKKVLVWDDPKSTKFNYHVKLDQSVEWPKKGWVFSYLKFEKFD